MKTMPNDMRDRLIDLLTDNLTHCDNPLQYIYDEIVERLADHLIENGAIIPPCKVGDTVYKCHTVNLKPTGEITKRTIKQITFSAFTVTDDGASGWFDIDDIGKTVFLTREDAEKSLREREGE